MVLLQTLSPILSQRIVGRGSSYNFFQKNEPEWMLEYRLNVTKRG